MLLCWGILLCTPWWTCRIMFTCWRHPLWLCVLLTKSLKGITAKRANAILARAGSPFWQEESYDHLVRQEGEFDKNRRYIEENPIRAGLVTAASQYRWSSAGWATGGSSADQGVRPTGQNL